MTLLAIEKCVSIDSFDELIRDINKKQSYFQVIWYFESINKKINVRKKANNCQSFKNRFAKNLNYSKKRHIMSENCLQLNLLLSLHQKIVCHHLYVQYWMEWCLSIEPN